MRDFSGCDDTSEEIYRKEEGRKQGSRKRLTCRQSHKLRAFNWSNAGNPRLISQLFLVDGCVWSTAGQGQGWHAARGFQQHDHMQCFLFAPAHTQKRTLSDRKSTRLNSSHSHYTPCVFISCYMAMYLKQGVHCGQVCHVFPPKVPHSATIWHAPKTRHCGSHHTSQKAPLL